MRAASRRPPWGRDPVDGGLEGVGGGGGTRSTEASIAPVWGDAVEARFERELGALERLFRRLCPKRVEPQRYRDDLAAAWRHYQACANLLLLLGPHNTPRMREQIAALPLGLWRLDTLLAALDIGIMLRMANFLGRQGKAVLPSCKLLLSAGSSLPSLLLGLFGAAAVAVRHSKTRGEVEKFYERLPQLVPGWQDGTATAARPLFRGRSGACYAQTIEDPDGAIAQANEMLDGWCEHVGVDYTYLAPLRGPTPPDRATAFIAYSSLSMHVIQETQEDEERCWLTTQAYLAKAAAADPGEFCPPFAQLEPPGQRSTAQYDVDRGQRLVEIAAGQVFVPGPRRVGERVGRNAPCPCGSGEKYKHCCLRAETLDPTERARQAALELLEAVGRRRERTKSLLQSPEQTAETTEPT